ncbi:MAG: cytochrome c oxidase subunit II [Hyphomicrobiales bacterium]|nr:cytochrome c oxidase subunit II [Hyphomicrobiales bacterium]
MLNKFLHLVLLAVSAVFGFTGAAMAQDAPKDHLAHPWQMYFQEAGSPTAERVFELNTLLLVIEVAIVIFVLALLVFILIRFNHKANPVPSKTSHNTLLEIVWTAVPILILVVIAVPSLKVLYFADKAPDADMTLKVTGHQWYWSYEYPDNGEFAFDSILVPKEDLKEGQPRLLTVDNEVVLPINTKIRLLMTSEDVIHNWAVPSLGVKLDTTPGRVNETWTLIRKEGRYRGQCSELCGVNHGFMPIVVHAVSKEAFAEWVKKAQEQFAKNDDSVSVARLKAR